MVIWNRIYAANFSLFQEIGAFKYIIGVISGWIYFATLESSSKQATLGKMFLRIHVTDVSGKPLSFGRATGRYFAKFLSALPLGAGFLMAGFTKKKQALHDIVIGSLVVEIRN